MESMLSWLKKTQNIDSNLCDMSDNSFLWYDNQRLSLHAIDKTILYLEEVLLNKNLWGVFLYPVEKTEVSIIMALESVYSFFYSERKRKKVLLISENVAVRETYSNLKTNHMHINELFPLGIIKFDGSIKRQIKTKHFDKENRLGCDFINTSNPKILPNDLVSEEIGCVIADVSSINKNYVEEIISWAKRNNIPSVIFLENNLRSENFDVFFSEQIPIWNWDDEDLIEDLNSDLDKMNLNPEEFENPLSNSLFHIKNLIKGVERRFIEINDKNLNPSLRECLQLYFELKKISKRDKKDIIRIALNTYSSTRKSFESMLAPLDFIERQCKQSFLSKTLQSRIEHLESFQTVLEKYDQIIGGVWGKTYSLAKVLYHNFHGYGNPKFEKVKDLIKESLRDKKKILILNYSEPYSRALSEAISKEFKIEINNLENQGIFITSILNKNISGDYDKCVFFGVPPWRANNILRSSYAKEIIFIVYPSEKALLKYQFEEEEKMVNNFFGMGLRKKFIENIFGKIEFERSPESKKKQESTKSILHLSESEQRDEEKLHSLFEKIEIDDDLSYNQEYDEEQEELDFESFEDGNLVINCYEIILEGEKILYVKPSRRIPIFKEGQKIDYYDVKKVKPGDLVIIIRNNLRNNLAQEIIKKVDKHPKMQKIKFLVNSWVTILKKGMLENNDSPEDFLKKLNKFQDEEKCQKIVNSLTIELWKEGYIIGPQNPKNIKLIGRIYNDSFLMENYVEVNAAVIRLRNMHQKLLRKLNDLVVKAGIESLKYPDEEELIDEEFNLHLEDFIGLVSIERVKSIQANVIVEKSKIDKVVKWKK